MKEKIYFAKIKPDAIVPSKHEENAGYDIYACFDELFILIMPHETAMIPTGIASVCSSDYYFQLLERGSTGTKGMGQRSGVIDSSYRGEWFVPITNHNSEKAIMITQKHFDLSDFSKHYKDRWGEEFKEDSIIFYPCDKAVCQAVLLPVPKVTIEELSHEDLLKIDSERGIGKLGSSGK